MPKIKAGKMVEKLTVNIGEFSSRSIKAEKERHSVGVITLDSPGHFLDENGVDHAYLEIYESDPYRDYNHRSNNPHLVKDPQLLQDEELISSVEAVVYVFFAVALILSYLWTILRPKIMAKCKHHCKLATLAEKKKRASRIRKDLLNEERRKKYYNSVVVPIHIPKIIRKFCPKNVDRIQKNKKTSDNKDGHSNLSKSFLSISKFSPRNSQNDSEIGQKNSQNKGTGGGSLDLGNSGKSDKLKLGSKNTQKLSQQSKTFPIVGDEDYFGDVDTGTERTNDNT